MERKDWEVVTGTKLLGFSVGVALFLALLLCSESGFIPIIDHANLLFHEAGHPFVGFCSGQLEPYGGTLGQLFFPSLLMISFWRKRQPISLAGAIIWFFENWLNIARYMADARKLELPLVGGGDHDWNTIFTRWDVLQYDDRIANAVKLLGWAGVIGICAWVLWRACKTAVAP
jgi:hypothetical protein